MDIINWADLVQLLTDWVADIWCWFLGVIFELATAFIQFVTAVFPAVSVPSWMYGTSFTDSTLALVGWVIPFNNLLWALGIVASFEFINAVVLPVYRVVMDLL